MKYQSPRGTEDVLPGNSDRWIWVENAFRSHVRRYGYQEIRTPTFEDTDLFVRGAGETSDIVTKQMYSFIDKGDRSCTLKPEGTAGVMRALVQHNLCPPGTVARLSYVTPIFRYERPQKGRLREAHQLGFELVGSSAAAADAEVIEVTYRFYESIGLGSVIASLNSLGRDECRARFRDAVLAYAQPLLADLDEAERAKAEKNPLRLLDSKDPKLQEAMKGAPVVLEFLEDESRLRFDTLQQHLTDAGVPFQVDSGIVRGLDYYTETVFEILDSRLGSQSALCGGGRYDNLIRELGGSATPSVGVGMGIERLLIVLDDIKANPPVDRPEVFLVAATIDTQLAVARLARELRQAGFYAMTDIDGRSMKSQLKMADRYLARMAVILGPDEEARGTVQLRNLDTSEQTETAQTDLAERLTAILR